jgi:hypothetical protein
MRPIHLPERTTALLGALIAAVILGTTGGCGFFDTRSVVQPIGDVSVPKRDALDPDSVLWNYQVGVRYSFQGGGNLDDSLDEFFVMRLAFQDSADLSLGSMNKPQHLKAFEDRSFVAGDTLWFEFPTFEDRDKDFISATEARYDTLSYIFQILQRVPGEPDSATVVETYSGRATIYFVVLPNGDWVMRQWFDFEDPLNPSNQTWGRYLGEVVPTKPLPR